MKKIYSIAFICFVAMLFITSCQQKTPKPPKKFVPTQGTVIFLDTSMSMSGYFRTASSVGTTIQRFMLADLLGILAEDNLTPVHLSLFGSEIAESEKITSLRKLSFFESQTKLENTYSETETNLIGVFENEQFGRNEVSIIISDGIQSAKEGSEYIAGFDTKIFNVIRDKNDTGIYLWLIGVKSGFNGYIYPGRPNLKGIRAPLWHAGIRPVYIWIASHDETIGHSLTEKIVTQLRSIAGSSDAVKVAGLTFVKPPDVKIELDTDSSSSPIKVKKKGKNTFEWRMARTQESNVTIPVSLKETKRSNLDVEWNINLELEPKNRWAKFVKEDGDWTLNLSYRLIPSGSSFMPGCSFDKGEIIITAVATPEINPEPWWKQWSTEDDSLKENADKTLYLDKLSSIIEEPLKKSYTAGKVLLKVRKP